MRGEVPLRRTRRAIIACIHPNPLGLLAQPADWPATATAAAWATGNFRPMRNKGALEVGMQKKAMHEIAPPYNLHGNSRMRQ